MPIYEYLCNDCKRKFSCLHGVTADSRDPVCPRCSSTDLTRLMSRFALGRSEEDMLENLVDPSQIGDLDNPRDVARWAKKMSGALGEDLGEDVEEMMEAEFSGGDKQSNSGDRGGEDTLDSAGEDDL